MNKLLTILHKHRHVIIWTALYVLAMWTTLKYLFNFDMFSGAYWHRLMRAELRGFGGFVFGLLILAMVPMYIATTTIIARTGAPIFEFPTLAKIFNLFTPTIDAPPPAPEAPSEPAPEQDTTPPKKYPGELVGPFERARTHVNTMQKSDFDMGKTLSTITAPDITVHAPAPDSAPIDTTDTGLPLPDDFDTEIPDDAFNMDNGEFMGMTFDDNAPTFTDITFGDTPDDDQTDNTNADEQEPNPVAEFLGTHNVQIIDTTDDDIIITDKYAIATHDDTDFWVVNNESWFATGRQKPAPNISVQNVAAEHKVQPVLYLGQKNIMDIDEHITQWTNDGIMVITDLNELL